MSPMSVSFIDSVETYEATTSSFHSVSRDAVATAQRAACFNMAIGFEGPVARAAPAAASAVRGCWCVGPRGLAALFLRKGPRSAWDDGVGNRSAWLGQHGFEGQ